MTNRNTIPVGVMYARPQDNAEPVKVAETEHVKVAETIYIGDGDSVAVVVAKTTMGVVPLIIPVASNQRPEPKENISRYPTLAPSAPSTPPTNPRMQKSGRRRRLFSDTILPRAKAQ
ncbi:MAG: hypothetical protein AAGE52_09140 [Myxococcota bacterium]